MCATACEARVVLSRCEAERSRGPVWPVCCRSSNVSILRGCTASAGAVLHVHRQQGSAPRHSNSPLSILTNVTLMRAKGGAGKQMFPPAAALFSKRGGANVGPCSSCTQASVLSSVPDLNVFGNCSRQCPSLHYTSCPCSVFPITTPCEHGPSA